MNKFFIASVIALSALSLSGCANSGNQSLKKETEESVKTKITEGVSTKSDIKKYSVLRQRPHLLTEEKKYGNMSLPMYPLTRLTLYRS
ncbi:TPA: hypothetical protein ACF5RZ_003709 [Morganella morganii]